MRSVLPCSYVPKHAAPREPLGLEARSVLAVGLAAAVLPLGASPALADEAPASSSSTATASSTQQAAPSAGAPASSSASTAAAPATAAATASPTASPTAPPAAAAKPSPYAVGSAPQETASPTASPSSAAPERKASTSLAFSAPSSAPNGAVKVGIRLLSDGRGVKNGYVRLERATSRGWTYAGRLLTNEQGLGKGTLKVAGATKLRAAYTGSQVRTPAVSPARTVRAANRTTFGDAVLQEAARHVGKPYRYGAVGPDSFDCSGFTRYVYAQLGKSLPHNSRAQEDLARPVSKAEAQPGDLVFIQDVAGHVGIYAGNGKMYDAPRSGKTVTLRSIWTSNYTVGRV